MRLVYAKIAGLCVTLVGVLGGGFFSVALALYVQGGGTRVHEALARTSPPAEAGQRMLEIAAFSIGAGVGAGLLLLVFVRLGVTLGFFTMAEAIALLTGSTRSSNEGRARRDQ